MRRRLAVTGALVVLAVAFAVPIAVQAGVIHEWSKDTARTWFAATDAGGTRLVIYVDARDVYDQQPPSAGTESSRVYVSIYGLEADGTRGAPIAAGGADVAPGDFAVNGLAKSASLDCVVNDIYSFVTHAWDVDVAATVDWTKAGKATITKSTYNELYPWGRETGGLTQASSRADTDNAITIGAGPSLTGLTGTGWMSTLDGTVSTVGPH